jgi:hypothetical protein
VVELGAEERELLETLVRAGKSPAQLQTRARILLKADVSEVGEGWSDSAIAAALDTSINNVARTRQQLVEEGFESMLKRKYNPNSARPLIFDGGGAGFVLIGRSSRVMTGGAPGRRQICFTSAMVMPRRCYPRRCRSSPVGDDASHGRRSRADATPAAIGAGRGLDGGYSHRRRQCWR